MLAGVERRNYIKVVVVVMALGRGGRAPFTLRIGVSQYFHSRLVVVVVEVGRCELCWLESSGDCTSKRWLWLWLWAVVVGRFLSRCGLGSSIVFISSW